VRDDFDCDGRPDVAYLGREGSDVLVGIVRAATANAQVLKFGVGAGRQDAICAEPAILGVETMDFNAADDPELGAIEGCVPSKTCKA
jgi:hypothetical protein